jgi:hypothetical protein
MRFVRKLVLLSGMTRLLATTDLPPIPHLMAQSELRSVRVLWLQLRLKLQQSHCCWPLKR